MIDIILFHAFKHHYLYNVEWLKRNLGQWNEENSLLLKSIGTSQLDYYVGSLSVEEIKSEISNYLHDNELDIKARYEKWITHNNGFREIILSDKSAWTLRLIEKDTFIHIHPSRYSLQTIRIKANILKTVLCVLLFEDFREQPLDIRLINKYRAEYLNLSPIAPNSAHSELEKVFNLFLNP